MAAATGAQARDQVAVAGSSTVLPYASIVAEAFGENFDFPTPVVESGGSSAGLKKFCEGVGLNTIDIANAFVGLGGGGAHGEYVLPYADDLAPPSRDS